MYNRRHRQRLNQYSRSINISNVSVILAGRPLREIHTPARPFILMPFSISLYVASALGRLGPNGPLFRTSLVQILFNKEGRPVANYPLGLSSAAGEVWYAGAIHQAASRGIAGGKDAEKLY